MTTKERYRQLCETEGSYIPLFQQYWWMETVCHGKQWSVLLSEQANGFIDGALPFLIGSKLGLHYVLQPELTQYNGPWFHHHPLTGDPVEFEHRVAEDLLSQLEKLHLSVYLQRFSPEVTDWLPFYWHGYKQTTRYTYRFDPLPDLSPGSGNLQWISRRSTLQYRSMLLTRSSGSRPCLLPESMVMMT